MARRESWYRGAGGELVRRVTPRSGEAYEHVCQLSSFQAVAHAFDGRSAGARGIDLVAELDLPYSQAYVALAFLKERGLVESFRKRSYAADATLYESAMVELLVLPQACGLCALDDPAPCENDCPGGAS